MSRKVVVCFALAAMSSVVARAELTKEKRDALLAATSDVDRMVEARLPALGCPAFALGVVANGGLFWSKGYGTRVPGREAPVDARTVFRIGSLTKPIAAVLAMQLRDDGRLDLDAPATRYLPELSRVTLPPGSTPITTRELLSHRSGLPRGGDFHFRSRLGPTEAEVLAALDGLALESAPGTKTSYSNLGFALVGLEIGRIAGVRFRDFATRHLLRPLGMSSSVWESESVPAGRLAASDRTIAGTSTRPAEWHMGAAEAMGGLYSDVEDLAKFAAFEMSTGDDPVLRHASLVETQTPQPAGAPNGFDWGVFDSPVVGPLLMHAGQTNSYSSSIRILPARGLAVVALCSRGAPGPDVDHLAERAMSLLVDADEGPARAAPAEVTDALTRLEAMLAAPAKTDLAQLFTPGYLVAVPPAKATAFFQRIAADSGACASARTIDSKGPLDGTFVVGCDRATWLVQVDVEPRAPHRVDGVWFKPLVPNE